MAKSVLRGTVSNDLVREVKRISSQRSVSVSALLERAIDHYLGILDQRGGDQAGQDAVKEEGASHLGK